MQKNQKNYERQFFIKLEKPYFGSNLGIFDLHTPEKDLFKKFGTKLDDTPSSYIKSENFNNRLLFRSLLFILGFKWPCKNLESKSRQTEKRMESVSLDLHFVDPVTIHFRTPIIRKLILFKVAQYLIASREMK